MCVCAHFCPEDISFQSPHVLISSWWHFRRLLSGPLGELRILLRLISPSLPSLLVFASVASILPLATMLAFLKLNSDFSGHVPLSLRTWSHFLPAYKLWPTFSGLSSHESSIHLKIDLIMFYLFSNHLSSAYCVPSLVRYPGILWWTRSKWYLP